MDLSRRWSVIFLILLALIVAAVFFLGGEATRALWREPGPIEDVSAAAYLVAAVCGLLGARRSRGWLRWQFIFWIVFCLFLFGEETSYLQHYLGYSTPEAVAAQNAQREFNIHNLRALQGGSLLKSEAPLLEKLLKSQNLFQLGFTLYFLALPLGLYVCGPLRRLADKIRLLIAGNNLLLMAWVPIAVSVLFTLFSSGPTKSAVAETREMLYSLVIAAFLVRAVTGIPRRAGKAAGGVPAA